MANVSLGGFKLDTDGRLLSSAATSTAVASSAAVDKDPISTPWIGSNPADVKIGVAYSYDNTNVTTYVMNQISSYTEARHNTYGVPIWGVGDAIHSNSFAWGVAGVAGAYNTAASAFGGEFNIAVQSATPAVFTNAWALSLATGGDGQSTPTGYWYVAANDPNNAPSNIFVMRDEAWSPVISTGNILCTGFTAGLGGTKHFSAANGINLLNTTFTGNPFVFGTGSTALFSVNNIGHVGAPQINYSTTTPGAPANGNTWYTGETIHAQTKGVDRALSGVISAQNSGNTNNSASGSGADFNHNLTYAIPANFLGSGKLLRVTAHFSCTSGSASPTLLIKLKAGATSLDNVGTAQVMINSVTNKQVMFQYLIQATAAPSASSNVFIGRTGSSNMWANANIYGDIANPVALATNGALTLQMATQWGSAGTGTNTITLQQFIVEALN